MDSNKAAKMFVSWQKWRASFVPLGFIPDSQVVDQLDAKKIYLQGLSKDGYPVMIVKVCNHSPAKDQPQFKSNSLFSFESLTSVYSIILFVLDYMIWEACGSNRFLVYFWMSDFKGIS